MVAKIIDGKQISKNRLEFIKKEIEKREQNNLRKPCLAVVLIGSNPASKIYVKNKKVACDYVGIRSLVYEEDDNFTEEQLTNLILELNSREDVDGILVQLPLPKHINTQKIIELIKTDKDVDAFHPYNIGRLALRIPIMRPCTPKGVMTLLEESNIKVKTKNVTIVGASNIVGRPLALEMLLAGATVTVCHVFTSQSDLIAAIKNADVVVLAIGKPNVIKSEWFNPNSVVIDVGINRLADGSLCGDVDFESAKAIVSSITPVPGGVGPMTIAILMENTLLAVSIHDKQ